jgi:hypothetical protein
MAHPGRTLIMTSVLLLAAGRTPLCAQWLTDDDRAGLEGCTIGVASGRVTADGRPLLWKTRDADAPDNEARWSAAQPYSFLGVFNADGESPWMAVNTRGFALLNANSLDLPGSGNSGNGSFMRRAMAECATVADFQRLLDGTNSGTRHTQAHFAVIDSTGAAALFETGGQQYWKYDACDPSIPEGYVLRTNFAIHGGGSVGYRRYQRSLTIIAALRSANTFSPLGIIRSQMRDFSDAAGNPFPVPYPARAYPGAPFGFIETSASICGATSVSAVVIQGVLRGEPAVLSTMWTLLGLPAASITVPYWPAGPTPAAANGNPTSPLCDEANRLHERLFHLIPDPTSGRVQEYIDSYALRNQSGQGLWPRILPAEETVFADAAEQLAIWRQHSTAPSAEEMLATESRLADYAHAVLRAVSPGPHEDETGDSVHLALSQNYPNPFNGGTMIRFTVPVRGHVHLEVYDLLGRKMGTVVDEDRPAGMQEAYLDATGLASGVYWYRLTAGGTAVARRLLVIR